MQKGNILMKKAKTELLILGMSQSNFLDQLYGDVIKQTKTFEFSVDGFYDISKGIVPGRNIYSNHFNFKNTYVNRIQLFKSLIGFAFSPFFLKVVLHEFSQGNRLKSVFKKVKSLAKVRSVVKTEILKWKFDVYHFHFMTPQYVEPIYFLPKQAKVICSFWGSDLLRNQSPTHTFYISNALKRANIITIQTPDLGQILFNRFGYKIVPKTKFLRFTLNTQIFEELDKIESTPYVVNDFKNRFKINQNKVVVAVGHNGFSENNHLEILNSMNELPSEIKNKMVFILHFAYGGNENYSSKVKKTIKEYDDLEIVFMEDYFDKDLIAPLRKASDILIQMPVSDALSGAMTEVLYAGNTVLYGRWLPYGFFNELGIKMIEVNSFDDLKKRLVYALENLETLKSAGNFNKEIIINNLFPAVTTPAWIDVFNEVSQ